MINPELWATIVLALFVLLGLATSLLPKCEPFWFTTNRSLFFRCSDTKGGDFLVDIRDNGGTAVVQFGGQDVSLPFKLSRGETDTYSNGDVEFRYNREAYVSGLSAAPLGPCRLS